MAKGSGNSQVFTSGVSTGFWGPCVPWYSLAESSSGVLRTSLASSRASGAVLLMDADWTWLLCAVLGPWSLQDFWERDGHGEDDKFGGVRQWCGSWGGRIHGVVAAQLAGGSLTCLSTISSSNLGMQHHKYSHLLMPSSLSFLKVYILKTYIAHLSPLSGLFLSILFILLSLLLMWLFPWYLF